MNCFMGYNPLATKQVKVTVWVCEQDGATPVAPSNPSAGDCFIVYATDEAVLSNTPTSAKTYADGEWKDAEGGGGGGDLNVANVTVTGVGGYFSIEVGGNPSDGYDYVFKDGNGKFHYYVSVDMGDTSVFPLYYSGEYAIVTPYNVVTSVTGSAEVDPDNPSNYIVTGDCSFAGYVDA